VSRRPSWSCRGSPEAALDGAVEVEDEVGDLGALDVPAVGEVEDLEDWLERGVAREPQSARHAEVQREELVVLPLRIARDDRPIGLNPILGHVAYRSWLRRSRRQARVDLDAGHDDEELGVEAGHDPNSCTRS
jgi:hypothetical protein